MLGQKPSAPTYSLYNNGIIDNIIIKNLPKGRLKFNGGVYKTTSSTGSSKMWHREAPPSNPTISADHINATSESFGVCKGGF